MAVVAMVHPGQMGAALAVQAGRNGVRMLWCPTDRSEATARRAETAGLSAEPDLGALLNAAEIVLSVCPPEFAEDVASQVAERGYRGIFVEANAISPQRVAGIADQLTGVDARVVDGAIIGPPPGDGRSARLYMAGDQDAVDSVAGLFRDTAAEPVALPGGIGTASALKMAFASYNKASMALAAVAHALAARHQVSDELIREAEQLGRSPLARPGSLPGMAAKAWRWGPEMHEIADTLVGDGLPTDFAQAAEVVLARWQTDKDSWDLSVEDVLARLSSI